MPNHRSAPARPVPRQAQPRSIRDVLSKSFGVEPVRSLIAVRWVHQVVGMLLVFGKPLSMVVLASPPGCSAQATSIGGIVGILTNGFIAPSRLQFDFFCVAAQRASAIRRNRNEQPCFIHSAWTSSMNCYNVLVLGTAWGNGQVVRRSVFASEPCIMVQEWTHVGGKHEFLLRSKFGF